MPSGKKAAPQQPGSSRAPAENTPSLKNPVRPARLVEPVPPPDGGVVRATPADLAYVVHLQKRHGDAIGFLPRLALAQKIDLGRVWLARENGEPAGFLHHGTLNAPEVRIFQAAVQYDARRRRLGLALVDELLTRAAAAGARGVSLRCLSYLEANAFWTAAGFRLLATEPGAKGTLNVWVRELVGGGEWGVGGKADGNRASLPTPLLSTSHLCFSSRVHSCPSCGAPTTDTWSRGARRHRLCPACLAGRSEPADRAP